VFTVILGFDSIIFAVIIAAAMCLITFGKRSIKGFSRIFITFFAVNLLLGGGMTALFSFFNSFVGEKIIMIYGDVSHVTGKMPINVFALGVLSVTVIIFLFGRIYSRKSGTRNIKAEVGLLGKSVFYSLIEDSGNLLTERLSGEPVIFLSEKAMRRIISEEILSAMNNIEPGVFLKNKITARIVTYSTVNGSQTCMCIRPSKILINNKAVKAWITCGKCNIFGENDGIIPSVLVTD
jgi:hypothetical protein